MALEVLPSTVRLATQVTAVTLVHQVLQVLTPQMPPRVSQAPVENRVTKERLVNKVKQAPMVPTADPVKTVWTVVMDLTDSTVKLADREKPENADQLVPQVLMVPTVA